MSVFEERTDFAELIADEIDRELDEHGAINVIDVATDFFYDSMKNDRRTDAHMFIASAAYEAAVKHIARQRDVMTDGQLAFRVDEPRPKDEPALERQGIRLANARDERITVEFTVDQASALYSVCSRRAAVLETYNPPEMPSQYRALRACMDELSARVLGHTSQAMKPKLTTVEDE